MKHRNNTHYYAYTFVGYAVRKKMRTTVRNVTFFTTLFLFGVVSLTIFLQSLHSVQAAPGDGHMILFFDGATIPTGWSCISCTVGDDFYQRFVRGSDTYGGAGGSANHTHSYSASLSSPDQPAATESFGSGSVAANDHSHSLITTFAATSNLPNYRQLKIIRHNTNDEPALIPEGAIVILESTLIPNGDWVRYSVQDGAYIRGEDTVGASGGNNTHSHAIGGSIGVSTGLTFTSRGGGSQASGATPGHTHTFSGSTSSTDIQPPFTEIVLAQAVVDTTVPANISAMWDNEAPLGWKNRSDTTGPLYQQFLKPSSSYGASGGGQSHTHTNTTLVTSGSSEATNARGGASGASGSHTHTVSLNGYSTENQLPPFRDVIIAKKQEPSDISQSSYRWFRDTDSTDVGLALGSQDTAATSIGLPFRLRVSLSIATEALGVFGESFRLQYAEQSGTCDISFTGETYQDVTPSSGVLRYFDNPTPADGSVMTSNLNDPDPVSGNAVTQSYVESNTFTNKVAVVPVGDYGVWDFSLVDAGAPPDTNYCFRIVYSDGSLLSDYDVIPEIITADGDGNMILLYDGATVPTDWSCISCSQGQSLYQRFVRGAESYGGSGGSPVHGHTATGGVLASAATAGNGAGTGIADSGHTHSVTPVLDDASNIPPYRELKFIRYDFSGTPSTLPEGVIAMFDDTAPTGWTRYAVQDDYYIRGGTTGAIGGSLTHTHTVAGTTSTANGTDSGSGGSGPASAASGINHQHDLTGVSPTANHEPPYVEAVLAKASAVTSPPAGLVTFWDGITPGSWETLSTPGSPFHQRFVKPATTFGTTGGQASHTHANHSVSTTTPTTLESTSRDGGGSSSDHTHTVNISAISNDTHLPPYIDIIVAKQPVPNEPPDVPTSLQQFRDTLDTEISTGGYTNETIVQFRAQASDPDPTDELQLCVEVQRLGDSFINLELACGSLSSYTGTAVSVELTIPGLANSEEYHWQARLRDNSGVYSSWAGYGGNPESERDFAIDTIIPSGTVYDGTASLSDISFNTGSLDSLSANWDIGSGLSGLAGYEYSIGIAPSDDTVYGWTSAGTATTTTQSGLTLQTSETYYFNLRTTDNAGNQSIISSDGQVVAPSLSFSLSETDMTFDPISPRNQFSDEQETSLTTSTNARNGYEVRARASAILTSPTDSIPMFGGGTYAAPAEWATGLFGFGYTSSDTLIQGLDKFNPTTCAGGGSPPCFSPYTLNEFGDIVADNPGPILGSPIIDESFTVTSKVQVQESQNAGDYQTIIIFSATARY